ncbi:hypothetical protein PHMEG_00021010 [Phytophthora megakarya]|uniref:Uncharacterized protein n=1 Tax=Phytophthora megakarya TaxID=4795 RepID=A0A225VNN0_9STRA|nr:hypothetical protein PHMEG_00021010 [Phytophthora megakarya]
MSRAETNQLLLGQVEEEVIPLGRNILTVDNPRELLNVISSLCVNVRGFLREKESKWEWRGTRGSQDPHQDPGDLNDDRSRRWSTYDPLRLGLMRGWLQASL